MFKQIRSHFIYTTVIHRSPAASLATDAISVAAHLHAGADRVAALLQGVPSRGAKASDELPKYAYH
jgi:hypothetical protein